MIQAELYAVCVNGIWRLSGGATYLKVIAVLTSAT